MPSVEKILLRDEAIGISEKIDPKKIEEKLADFFEHYIERYQESTPEISKVFPLEFPEIDASCIHQADEAERERDRLKQQLMRLSDTTTGTKRPILKETTSPSEKVRTAKPSRP